MYNFIIHNIQNACTSEGGNKLPVYDRHVLVNEWNDCMCMKFAVKCISHICIFVLGWNPLKRVQKELMNSTQDNTWKLSIVST